MILSTPMGLVISSLKVNILEGSSETTIINSVTISVNIIRATVKTNSYNL